MSYDIYVALGDSLSIDAYAGPGLGAASLLFKNDAQRYPEFEGRDLLSHNSACRFLNLAKDGGTVDSTVSALESIQGSPARTLVTLTVGGNDFLAGLSHKRTFPDPWLALFEERFERLLALILEKFPNGRVLVGNVYDVTDGTGVAQSATWEARDYLPIIPQVNGILSKRTRAAGGVQVDIHGHFRGHCVRYADSTYKHQNSSDPTCWICLDIEPNARGSSEIRRLFWQAQSF